MTDEAVLEAQRRLWAMGDYGKVARHLLPISVDLIAAAGIRSGQRVLDIAVGDGNTTISAVRAGGEVVGIDLSPAQLALAEARLAREGIEVELHEANAEALPFPDDSFDVVVSSMGVIFAPDPVAASAEMARVCRPGGKVALTAWAEGGWSRTVWEEAAAILPPPSAFGPRSEEWGDGPTAVARLAAAGVTATAEERDFAWTFGSVAEAAAFFPAAAGPFCAMFAQAEAIGRTADVEAVLLRSIEERNRATDGTCAVPAPYQLVVGQVGSAA